MILNHNLPALNALRHNQINNSFTSKNLEKLSTGFQVNRAADDASGLAISEKMRAQIRGMNKAAQNTEHATMLIQTGEGGLQEFQAVLHRMKELAIQAANGTYHDDVDREALDMEVQELKRQLDQICDYTNYNDIKLLDGSLGAMHALSIGSAAYNTGSVGALAEYFQSLGFPIQIDKGVDPNDLQGEVQLLSYSPALDGKSANIIVQSASEIGESHPRFVMQVGGETYMSTFVTAGDCPDYIGFGGIAVNAEDSYIFTDEHGNVVAQIVCRDSASNGVPVGSGESGYLQGVRFEPTSAHPVTSTLLPRSGDCNMPIPSPGTMSRSYLSTEGSRILFQIGPVGSREQQVYLTIRNMTSANLGTLQATEFNPSGSVYDINVLTREHADDSIEILEAAIDQVSLVRAKLGSVQNRLGFTLNNLEVGAENLTAAESTIRDTDMAKEMMEFTKNNILAQASQAMLAQANTLPQGILTLLR